MDMGQGRPLKRWEAYPLWRARYEAVYEAVKDYVEQKKFVVCLRERKQGAAQAQAEFLVDPHIGLSLPN
jgi:hypothetical protein